MSRVAIAGLINLILVVGLYVFAGNSGIFSFGQMSFMAVGAYVAGNLVLPTTAGVPPATSLPGPLHGVTLAPIPAILVAAVVAALGALIVSLPLMRLNGIAASLAMFSVLVITHVVASNWTGTTGGTAGMSGVPLTTTMAESLVFAVCVICLAYAFQQSSIGIRLRASREDEIAAQSIGVGVFGERRVAFVLSGLIIGVGGALYAQFVGSFVPDSFYLTITFLTIAMLVVGGVNSLAGAVVGSVVISALAELLRRLEDGLEIGSVSIPARVGLQQVGLGVVMLGILLVRPAGLTRGREFALPRRLRLESGLATDIEVPASEDEKRIRSTVNTIRGG
jgi:branched-chain amino acid transport system permease protein